MSANQTIPFAKKLLPVCQLLGIDFNSLLIEAGLPLSLLEMQSNEISLDDYFLLFDRFERRLAPSGADHIKLARHQAENPQKTPLLGFYASATVAVAFRRLQQFKKLLGPFVLTIDEVGDGWRIGFGTTNPDRALPAGLGIYELVLLVECLRLGTGTALKPLSLVMMRPSTPQLDQYFGVTPQIGEQTQLWLSHEQLAAPLSPPSFGNNDRRQLNQQRASSQLEVILETMLPSGNASLNGAAEKMALSKRSLQRALAEEGLSFKQVLEAVRRRLAMTYLQNSDLRTDEIALMLAYQETNSFYRAFQTWTGKTPKQVRAELGGGWV